MSAHYENARVIGRRICLGGVLRLTAPCHLGSGDPDATSDRPLMRDSNGRPYLAGTALGGILRSTLAAEDKHLAADLFGGDWGDEDGVQSRLVVFDAPIAQEGPVVTELRDGVKIDNQTGTAADKKKYDIELLPVGTAFRLTLELDLFGDSDKDALLLTGLLRLLLALEHRHIRLGARTRRGFGRVEVVLGPERVAWQLEEYDLQTVDGLRAWLGRELDGLPSGWPTGVTADFENTEKLASYWRLATPAPAGVPGFHATMQLAISGSLILRSGGHDGGDADSIHLHRIELPADGTEPKVVPVLSGTSLAGALRAQCLRIAQTIAGSRGGRAVQLVEDMFGPEVVTGERGAFASRVWVDEAPIEGGRILRHTRVSIDPWTGGAKESLLFTEDVQFGGSVALWLRLDHDAEADERQTLTERALLVFGLRDLATGLFAVGGEDSVGRGRLEPASDGPFLVVNGGELTLSVDDDGGFEIVPVDGYEEETAALNAYLGEEGNQCAR